MSDPLNASEAPQIASPETKSKKRRPDEDGAYSWLQPTPVFCDDYAADAFAGGIVRMSFGEYIGKDVYPIYRVAIAMPISDVKALVRTLTRIIKESEEVVSKSTPPANPG